MLTDPFKETGRNITMDRYYTSIELAEELYTEKNLKVVGTLQLNRKDISNQLKDTRDRVEHSSKFAFTDPTSSGLHA